MDELREQRPTFLSLDDLKAATYAQILAFSERKEGLQKISTDITDLIARYNQKKSYLGHAAHWYGELNWWLRIIVSIVAAGVAILLTVPWVISIALSLVASCLLMNHYEVTQARDRLICTDLNEQNRSVQTSLDLLNHTNKELEENLKSLCKLAIEMGAENQKLRVNVDAMTQQSEEYRNKTIHLQFTIEALQQKNELLRAQVSEAQNQLNNYDRILSDGSTTYATANFGLKKTVTETQEHIEKIFNAADQFLKSVGTLNTPTGDKKSQQSTDSDDGDTSVLTDALDLLQDDELNKQLSKIERQENSMLTPIKGINNYPRK